MNLTTKFLYNEKNLLKKHSEDMDMIKIGTIKYNEFIVPICIIRNENHKMYPNLCAIRGKGNSWNTGCIAVGKCMWDNMSLSDLKAILYHELAHIILPDFFDECMADEFAVAHVGANKLIRANFEFDSIRSQVLGKNVRSHPIRFELINKKNQYLKDKMKIVIEDEDYRKENK